jgi:hypothetical protein
MNYREEIRKYISCPQLGDIHYGKWGALRVEQRLLINRLLDDLDNADKTIKYLQQRIDKAIEYIDEMCLCSSGYFDYGDDLSPKHIVDILRGGENNR